MTMVFEFLDSTFPIENGIKYDSITNVLATNENVFFQSCRLVNIDQYLGFKTTEELLSILFENNGLKVEIVWDIQENKIKDILLESALTTIIDWEDGVSIVNVEEKIKAYDLWEKLHTGNIECSFEKNRKMVTRRLNSPDIFEGKNGVITIKRTSLLLLRTVGIHMPSAFVETDSGIPVYEWMIDALMGVAKARNNEYIYIVVPKLSGPEDVNLVTRFYIRLEELLLLKKGQIRLGIMDEERRLSLNLRECINKSQGRCFFINTGFLDRTGSEIRTITYFGPVLPISELKTAVWRKGYEQHNVQMGLEFTIPQIGKGMWDKPDLMKEMYLQKESQVLQGASCAWIPSPMASTIHTLHYHKNNVSSIQKTLDFDNKLSLDMTVSPLWLNEIKSKDKIYKNLQNCVTGMEGYVKKWIHDGIGCSKIANTDGINLMEDRATLRISSQLLCNWLYWGLINKKMIVENLSTDENTTECVLDLIINANQSAEGYTEHILHTYRKKILGNR